MQDKDNWEPVSIIIPMYNESKRIRATVQRMNIWMDIHPDDEVIFSDDGSTDDTVAQVMALKRHKRMILVASAANGGKWSAIKKGFWKVNNRYFAILDADLSVSPIYVDNYRKKLAEKILIIGNRYGKFSSEIPFNRKFPSRVFNALMRLIVGIKVRDSQCPFKMGHARMVSVFGDLQEKGFSGDVEFLVLAKKYGFSMLEEDVMYVFDDRSTLNVKKHAPDMFKALFRIRNRF